MAEKTVVNVRELRDNLSAYIGQATRGDEVIITLHGKQVARLLPMERKRCRAEAYGSMRGTIWMAPDFDRTPDDIIAAMEGADE